jgi:hypothetical protein
MHQAISGTSAALERTTCQRFHVVLIAHIQRILITELHVGRDIASEQMRFRD